MKYYKKCQGCGLNLQIENKNYEGYTPNIDFDLCQKCFKSKNYGEFSNNLNIFYKTSEIKKISNDNVIMIIDVLNPYETLIKDINKYVNKENLIILVNKIDVLPKSINKDKILNWIINIIETTNIKFNSISLVSTIKKINIDTVASFILSSKKNTSIIGYSNVGKSSLIKAIFNSVKLNVNNLITNSIGTTKQVIKLKFENKIINDYPGLLLHGSYQNKMNISQLRETNFNKENKVINYQLGENQSMNVGNYLIFSVKDTSEKNGYQFLFSNLINIYKSKYRVNNEFKKYLIKHKKNRRYDLIISGLGIITFQSMNQTIELQLPKNINFNIIDSLHSKFNN